MGGIDDARSQLPTVALTCRLDLLNHVFGLKYGAEQILVSISSYVGVKKQC